MPSLHLAKTADEILPHTYPQRDSDARHEILPPTAWATVGCWILEAPGEGHLPAPDPAGRSWARPVDRMHRHQAGSSESHGPAH